MLAQTKGNLSDVRERLKGLQRGEIVDFIKPPPMKDAEIFADVSADWFVIETYENQERTVAAHCISRRFGIYLPERQETFLRRGRKVNVRRPMFTGLVFAFVWDIERHWRRVTAIPGVARIKMITAADDTMIPLIVPDEMINRIRMIENSERPLCDQEYTIADASYGSRDARKRKRKGRKKQKEAAVVIEAGETLVWRPWDVFRDGISSVDSETRNQTLLAALSLPSQQPLVGSVVSGVVD